MPFRSTAQRAWMHANHPRMADRWEKHTPQGTLPTRVSEDTPDPDANITYIIDDIPGHAIDDRPEHAVKVVTPRGNKQGFPSRLDAINYILWHARSLSKISNPKIKDMNESSDALKNDDLPDPKDDGDEYMKIVPTWAIEMDEPFVVDTLEGEMPGKAGDFLAKGPEGDMWVVDHDIFKRTYKNVQDDEKMPKMVEVFSQVVLREKEDLDSHRTTMESIFKIKEGDLPNHPPPGSRPMNPTDWNKLGPAGQSAKQGLDTLGRSGNDMKVYATPDGQYVGYPDVDEPGREPMKADLTKGGVWTPLSGSTSGTQGPGQLRTIPS